MLIEISYNEPVKIVDVFWGKGKTSLAIQMMNNPMQDNFKFIHVIPFLDEAERIKREVTSRVMYSPQAQDEMVKGDHLYHLIEAEVDIVTTHKLFQDVGNMYAYLKELFKDIPKEKLEVEQDVSVGIQRVIQRIRNRHFL